MGVWPNKTWCDYHEKIFLRWKQIIKKNYNYSFYYTNWLYYKQDNNNNNNNKISKIISLQLCFSVTQYIMIIIKHTKTSFIANWNSSKNYLFSV